MMHQKLVHIGLVACAMIGLSSAQQNASATDILGLIATLKEGISGRAYPIGAYRQLSPAFAALRNSSVESISAFGQQVASGALDPAVIQLFTESVQSSENLYGEMDQTFSTLFKDQMEEQCYYRFTTGDDEAYTAWTILFNNSTSTTIQQDLQNYCQTETNITQYLDGLFSLLSNASSSGGGGGSSGASNSSSGGGASNSSESGSGGSASGNESSANSSSSGASNASSESGSSNASSDGGSSGNASGGQSGEAAGGGAAGGGSSSGGAEQNVSGSAQSCDVLSLLYNGSQLADEFAGWRDNILDKAAYIILDIYQLINLAAACGADQTQIQSYNEQFIAAIDRVIQFEQEAQQQVSESLALNVNQILTNNPGLSDLSLTVNLQYFLVTIYPWLNWTVAVYNQSAVQSGNESVFSRCIQCYNITHGSQTILVAWIDPTSSQKITPFDLSNFTETQATQGLSSLDEQIKAAGVNYSSIWILPSSAGHVVTSFGEFIQKYIGSAYQIFIWDEGTSSSSSSQSGGSSGSGGTGGDSGAGGAGGSSGTSGSGGSSGSSSSSSSSSSSTSGGGSQTPTDGSSGSSSDGGSAAPSGGL